MSKLLPLTILLSLTLTACFDRAGKSTLPSGTKISLITPQDFGGAAQAKNIVSGIKVFWEPSRVPVMAYRIYSVVGANYRLLSSVGSETTSFVDGSTSWGAVYRYAVRAVDLNGTEEQNTNVVSNISWGGVTSVVSNSRTTLTLNFEPSSVVDEIRISVRGSSAEDTKTEVIPGSSASKIITGLKPGFTYTVSAQAYNQSLNLEDGNEITKKASTLTMGYDQDGVTLDPPKWMNVTNIRAFGASPNAPIHPTKPNMTPRIDVVEISFKKFSGSTTVDRYVVTRAALGETLDTTIEARCEKSTATSCRVVCNPQTGTAELNSLDVMHCRDEQVAPSPAKYHYTISLKHTEDGFSWVEPFPTSKIETFSVKVSIPPKNMILVAREAVNYEMCSLQMSSTPDPFNHNRCDYSGIGSTPHNSGPGKAPLNLPSNYYDFGYSIFAERFRNACKWTRGVDGGMCGPGGTPGNCLGAFDDSSGNPSDSIGVDGNVYMTLVGSNTTSTSSDGHNRCYIKEGGVWIRNNNVPTQIENPSAAFAKMYTIDPGTNDGWVMPDQGTNGQFISQSVCQSKVDPNYGQSRLPRMREFRAMTAFATVPNDLYSLTYTQAKEISDGGLFDSSNRRCPNNIRASTYSLYNSLTTLDSIFTVPNNEFLGFYANSRFYGGRNFKLNASVNLDCHGRYGISNVHMIANYNYTSDLFDISNTMVTGVASIIDNGNTDLLRDLNGTNFGYSFELSQQLINASGNSYLNIVADPVTHFVVPLGLPIIAPNITGYIPAPSLIQRYGGTNFNINNASSIGNLRPLAAAAVNGRWQTDLRSDVTGNPSGYTIMCVLPTE